MTPYRVAETYNTDSKKSWQILLNDTPIPYLLFTEDDAWTICDALNDALNSGYDLGYNAGYDARERIVV
jgi:hypothetical protein